MCLGNCRSNYDLFGAWKETGRTSCLSANLITRWQLWGSIVISQSQLWNHNHKLWGSIVISHSQLWNHNHELWGSILIQFFIRVQLQQQCWDNCVEVWKKLTIDWLQFKSIVDQYIYVMYWNNFEPCLFWFKVLKTIDAQILVIINNSIKGRCGITSDNNSLFPYLFLIMTHCELVWWEQSRNWTKVKVVKWCQKRWNWPILMYIYHIQCEILQKIQWKGSNSQLQCFYNGRSLTDRSSLLKTQKTKGTKTWITHNFELVWPIQGRTM